MNFTRTQIENTMIKKGYSYFYDGDYNVNIILIRNSETGKVVTNKFDDLITLSYKVDGKWCFNQWVCTTDPGTHWVKNLLDVKGVARLVPGQYSGSHIIRKHQGKYDALCQDKPIKVYRDKNKDMIYDETTIVEGVYGINIHKAGTDSTLVDRWSAGCQVFKTKKSFDLFMSILYKSRDKYANRFTITLLESKDIK